MAEGDQTVMDTWAVQVGDEIHDMDTDTWKFALITSSTTPSASDATAHFGGTGTTNYATNEVTAGGNYTAGGVTLTSVAYSNTAGVTTFEAAKVSIAQNASNPTNARWGIIYNNTDANKRVVAFVDLGSVQDLSAGNFEFRFNSVDGTGAIFTLTTNA